MTRDARVWWQRAEPPARRSAPPSSENEPPAAALDFSLPACDPSPEKAVGERPSDAVAFLQKLRPDGPWVLIAIEPDSGDITAITAMTEAEVDAFIHNHNGRRNIYYSVNPTRAPLNRKARKTDIAAIEFLIADLDPKENESPDEAKARYRAKLEDEDEAPACTAIVDSGNGLQVLWRLSEPIKLAEPEIVINAKGASVKVFPKETAARIADAEARSQALMERLGSVAGTQNIDRILRLPGTINLPNKKKREAGRIACQTKLLQFDGATCSLEDFPLPKSKDEDAKGDPNPTVDKLPRRAASLLRVKDKGAYPSRSELLLVFLCDALRAKASDEAIIAACLDDKLHEFGIYQHIQEKGGRGYLERQLDRAKEKMREPKGLPPLPTPVSGVPVAQFGPLSKMADRAAEILLDAKVPFYQRGDRLVRPVIQPAKSFHGGSTTAAQLVEVEFHYMP
jgi:hypothetical protein